MAEKIMATYSGFILKVDWRGFVIIRVSIDGIDHKIKCSIVKFPFSIHTDMKLAVDLIENGETKKIVFRKAVPCKLSQEECDILEYI